jgi:hypothetical protein
MRIIGLALAAAIAIAPISTSFGADDTCVASAADAARNELKTARRGPELISTVFFFPAGSSVDVILREKFEATSTYFALVESKFEGGSDGKASLLIHKNSIRAKQIPPEHTAVKNGEAQNTETLITVVLPSSIGGWWEKVSLYIFKCAGREPAFASSLTMPASSSAYSTLAVSVIIIVIYVLAAIASAKVDEQRLSWIRYLDPVVLTAGPTGKGSLSKLQILFFSVIVFGLLGYIFLRTGLLSEISKTVLVLLGIAGVGSAASKATDVQRNRIKLENWAWFISKRWLPRGGLAALNQARWRDIVTSDGEFNVYRFQSLIFSLVVGGALLAAGITELATFTIPETLLGVLGLSQVVYLGGKLVSPPSCDELNKSTEELRELERTFIKAAGNRTAAAARRLPEYDAYMERAKIVRIMFQEVTGHPVNENLVRPSMP